jgi:hypothetical protein
LSAKDRINMMAKDQPVQLVQTNWKNLSRYIVNTFTDLGVLYCIERDRRSDLHYYNCQQKILGSYSKHFYVQIAGFESAYQVWSHLQQEFKAQAANHLLITHEERKALALKPGKEIIDYVTRAREL